MSNCYDTKIPIDCDIELRNNVKPIIQTLIIYLQDIIT